MGGDRDLFVIGAGAGMALLLLALPVPFGLRAVLAVGVISLFLILAFLRIGPDRLTLEDHLWRQLRFRLTPRRRVYQRGEMERKVFPEPRPSAPAPALRPAPPRPRRSLPALPPLALDVDAREAFWAVRLGLAVTGIYFVWWLGMEGGAREVAAALRILFAPGG